MKKVYCLVEFDSLECENQHEVLGVYTSKEIAQQTIQNQVDFLKKDLANDYEVGDAQDCNVGDIFAFGEICKPTEEGVACKVARLTTIPEGESEGLFVSFIITEIDVPDTIQAGDKVFPVFEQYSTPAYQYRMVNFVGVSQEDAEGYVACEDIDNTRAIDKEYFEGGFGRIVAGENVHFDRAICSDLGWFIGWDVLEMNLLDTPVAQ